MRGRVLIVDDERFFRDLYQEVLEGQGHLVVPAGSAEEAMREVQGQHFDLILADLVMPGTDGIDLVKQMRASDPRAEVVAIAGGDVRMAVRAIREGCADYVLKPVDREQLAVVAERVIERVRLKSEHERLVGENLEFVKSQALYRHCLDILATLDLEKLQDLVLSVLTRTSDAQGGALWVADERGRLGLRAYGGLLARNRLEPQIDPKQGPLVEPLRQGAPFAAPGSPGEAFYVPLVAAGDLVGLALLADRARGRFAEEQLAGARLIADFAAIAVKNARRFQALERVGLRDRESSAYNVAYFIDYAGKESYKARRYGRQFSMVVISVDNLEHLRKQVDKDALQKAIRGLTGALSKVVRDADILAKVSDNEYYVLLPETDHFGSLMFLRRAAEAIRAEPGLRELDRTSPVLISMGPATFPRDGEDFDELLHWCRQRMEEQRGSLVRRLHLDDLEPGAFWELFDMLLGERLAIPESTHSARSPADADLFAALQREVARELERDPKARGLVYLSTRSAAAPPLLEALQQRSRENRVEGLAQVHWLSRRAAAFNAHPQVTPVFLDGDERLGECEFLLYLNEHGAYGLLQRPGERLFHTSDTPLVDALVSRLQNHYDLQPF
jgi:diguanylate cyclase (GGDEF)-like protein